jgi:hypothetical protein
MSDAPNVADGYVDTVFGGPSFKGITGSASLMDRTPGDVLRLTATYVGAWRQLANAVVLSEPETFKTSVSAYAALVRDKSNGTLNVVALAPISSGPFGDNSAVFDVMVSGYPDDITLAAFINSIERPDSSAEITAVELLPRAIAGDPETRNTSLQQAQHDANASNGTNNPSPGVVPFLPSTNAGGFGAEFGKYAGVVFAIAVLVGGAYFIRSMRD